MPGTLTLIVTAGPMAGKTFTFDEHDTLLCGRMADCHVCLPDDRRISRHHFLLEVNPPDARLRDLGSLHGTYVNGQKYGGRAKHETPEEGARREYPQVDLHDGDEITVGGHPISGPGESDTSSRCVGTSLLSVLWYRPIR